MDSKISIIIPIFNAEEHLSKCISSVISQTYSNLEIILINDGSTDGSLAICKAFADKDKRIKVISKKNEGVSSARNTGLDVATGEYVGFIDSDDYVSELMFEKMIKTMIDYQAEVVECGYINCDYNGNIRKIYELKESVLDGEYSCSYMYLSRQNTTNYNWNKLYKASLFIDIRYPHYAYSEDYWVNTMIFNKCKRKVTISDCLYYYVFNEKSAVRSKFNIIKRMDTINAAENLYDFHSKHFDKLCSFIAFYICNYVLTFYEMISREENKNEIYQKQLNEIFIKYFYKIDNNTIKLMGYKLYVYMLVYRINPYLYFLLKRMIYSGKSIYCKNKK